jgi:hypothetical protein
LLSAQRTSHRRDAFVEALRNELAAVAEDEAL